jgi:hypothetical protein
MTLVKLSLLEPSSTMSKDMIIGILTQFFTKVNARYNGLIVIKNPLFISPYKIFLSDSNGHGCYFRKVSIVIFE